MRNALVLILISFVCLSGCKKTAEESIPVPTYETKSPSGFRCGETYVELYHADGYLHFKEYHVQSELKGSEIVSQIQNVREQLTAVRYCENEFGFEFFEPKEVSWFHDRGFITGEYHLKTDEKNVKRMIYDSFARVLRRPVEVVINEDHVILEFDGTGMTVAENNADGVYGKDGRVRLNFRNGDRKFEAVFTWDEDDSLTPIVDHFGEDIHVEKERVYADEE